MSDTTPQGPKATLVRKRDQKQVITTSRQECAPQALLRGIVEYLETQAIKVNGRSVGFKSVVDRLPDFEQGMLALPAAACVLEGDGEYRSMRIGASAGAFVSTVSTADTRSVGSPCDYEADIRVWLWANDPQIRSALLALVEDMLNPVDWMQGARIALPFYHGVHAEYQLKRSGILESSEDVAKRFRRASVLLHGVIPLVRLLGPFGAADIHAAVERVDDSPTALDP